MRTLVWFSVCAALVACGDDGGSTTVDSMGSGSGSDAAGSGDGGGGSDAAGLACSTDIASPTDISIGQNAGGPLAAFVPQNNGPACYWRFNPPTSASYTITLSGSAQMTAIWCGNSVTPGGCLCDMTGAAPYPCCTTGAGSCTAITKGAIANDDGVIVVTNDGTASGNYMMTITGP